jgi:hypothetical protein
MNLFEELNDKLTHYLEFELTKWTSIEKRQKKKAIRRAHRGTNWKMVKPKKNYKRFRIKGTDRYVLRLMSPTERQMKKRIGHTLGRRKDLRR